MISVGELVLIDRPAWCQNSELVNNQTKKIDRESFRNYTKIKKVKYDIVIMFINFSIL